MTTLDNIVSMCKRRGFIFPSSEIYGGLNGFYDYGPLGVELLNNIKRYWWEDMTYRANVVGLDAAIMMHPKVWKASGHIDAFMDPMIDNRVSKARFRADVLIEEHIDKLNKKGKTDTAQKCQQQLDNADSNEKLYNIIIEYDIKDPVSGTNDWTEVRNFNLMFSTNTGAIKDENSTVYFRPETAQGIFVNFKSVQETTRKRLPFGIAQIGKAFRNEVNTKNFLFRTREFEQMEMQFFVKPGEEETWFDYWVKERLEWYKGLGFTVDKLRIKEHTKLAHYAKRAVDIEYEFPFGWGEIEGIHSRTDYDLKQHQTFSGKKLEYIDPVDKSKILPYVIETSAGASRNLLAVLCNAYDIDTVTLNNDKEQNNDSERTLLRFPNRIAPIKAAILPLMSKGEMFDKANEIYNSLIKVVPIEFDDTGSIGKRYRRQDEIGTPICITIDSETITKGDVTVRYRDTTEQISINENKLEEFLIKEFIIKPKMTSASSID